MYMTNFFIYVYYILYTPFREDREYKEPGIVALCGI